VAVEIRTAHSSGSSPGATTLRIAKLVNEFGLFQRRTLDPSVRLAAARIWAGWDPTHSLEDNVERLAVELDEFVGARGAEGLNTFVVWFATPNSGAGAFHLVRLLLQILRMLGDLHPSRNCHPRVVEAGAGWRLRYAGADLRVDLFAPCFGPLDPRRPFGLESTFFLFRLLPGQSPLPGAGEAGLAQPIGPGWDRRLTDRHLVAA
jgi:hypothetical protein